MAESIFRSIDEVEMFCARYLEIAIEGIRQLRLSPSLLECDHLFEKFEKGAESIIHPPRPARYTLDNITQKKMLYDWMITTPLQSMAVYFYQKVMAHDIDFEVLRSYDQQNSERLGELAEKALKVSEEQSTVVSIPSEDKMPRFLNQYDTARDILLEAPRIREVLCIHNEEMRFYHWLITEMIVIHLNACRKGQMLLLPFREEQKKLEQPMLVVSQEGLDDFELLENDAPLCILVKIAERIKKNYDRIVNMKKHKTALMQLCRDLTQVKDRTLSVGERFHMMGAIINREYEEKLCLCKMKPIIKEDMSDVEKKRIMTERAEVLRSDIGRDHIFVKGLIELSDMMKTIMEIFPSLSDTKGDSGELRTSLPQGSALLLLIINQARKLVNQKSSHKKDAIRLLETLIEFSKEEKSVLERYHHIRDHILLTCVEVVFRCNMSPAFSKKATTIMRSQILHERERQLREEEVAGHSFAKGVVALKCLILNLDQLVTLSQAAEPSVAPSGSIGYRK